MRSLGLEMFHDYAAEVAGRSEALFDISRHLLYDLSSQDPVPMLRVNEDKRFKRLYGRGAE